MSVAAENGRDETLGVGMFGLYLVYVGQEVLRAALANRFGGC